MEWISVKDKLPIEENSDTKGNVLGWDKIQNEVQKCNFNYIIKMKIRFTHWMPLPEPPEPPKQD